MQLTPNATRLLHRWGLKERLEKVAASPEVFTILPYKGDKVLGRRDNFGKEMISKYGSPFWDMHRADLQLAMFERARELGVKFRFGATADRYDFQAAKVFLADGGEVSGDLVIAADGELVLGWVITDHVVDIRYCRSMVKSSRPISGEQ